MNKKGDVLSLNILFLIVGIVFLALFMFLGVVLATYTNIATSVPPELRMELIVLRFVNNPDCFTYLEENSGSAYPGVIDLDKFTKEKMNACYRTAELEGIKSFNFRLNLKNTGKKVDTDKYKESPDFTIFKEVLVKDGNKLKKDILEIFVQKV